VIASHRGEEHDERVVRDMPFDDTDVGADSRGGLVRYSRCCGTT
jgi:hypothetical protein